MTPRHGYHVVKAFQRRLQSSLASTTSGNNAFISQLKHDCPRPEKSGGGLLSGKQIAVKDNIATVDFPTTCASSILREYTSPYDATVVRLLRENGAEIIGKTNMDEFGMGSHSTNSAFGAVKNVVGQGKDRSAGGSSGGSAVAVATGCWAALGTDTGGSVRLPAAYNGVFGFKPSYGLISRWGVVDYANSLDTVGIMANSTSNIREVFRLTSKYDPRDPTSLPKSTRQCITSQNANKQPHPLKIGIPIDYAITELHPTILQAWITTLQTLQSNGHTLHPISLPTTKQALSAYYIIAPAEASSNLARYDGVRYGTRAPGSDGQGSTLYSTTRDQGFGDEVKRRILLGSYTLSAEAMDSHFIQAQRIRRLVQRDFNRVFTAPNPLLDDIPSTDQDERVDVLICPTAPNPAPFISDVKRQSSVEAYTTDIFTVPASLAGLPAISIPLRNTSATEQDKAQDKAQDRSQGEENGADEIGMQVIGQFGYDDLVLSVSYLFETLGLAKTRVVSATSYDDAKSPAIKFDENLARSYVNMREYYGNGMAAVQHVGKKD